MDFKKEIPVEDFDTDFDTEFDTKEITPIKSLRSDPPPQYFTNIDGKYCKDVAGREELDELKTLVDTAYHLPDGYTQLDYVECPQSAWAGFTIPNYTYKGYDILESKTMPYQVTTLAAFAGYKTSGIVMGYENSTTRLYAGQNAVDLIGTQAATVNNIYYHRGMKTVDISEFNVGYYRDDNYPFYGRIYYFHIYRCNNTSEGISMIYNFIPAKRLSDNKIGLYDAVNDTFYSSTTGTEFAAPASV